jgi:pyruvate dehydrogenase E2 component (dihydrolipoamide acetyltransferase)
MAIEFKLPELGENVNSGDVVRILVKAGDTVRKDQPVLELETGKATVEVPSPVAGIVKQIHVKEGAKVQVGQVVLTLDESAAAAAAATPVTKEKPVAPKAFAAAAAPVAKEKPVAPKAAAAKAESAPAAAAPAPASPSASSTAPAGVRRPVMASPSTRQFARELGLDVREVEGSGPGGRISEDDIKARARELLSGAAQAPGRAVAPPLPDFAKWGPVERKPMNNVRAAAAQHLSMCWNTIPHVTLHDKADVTDLEKLRQELKSKADAAGARLTVTAFLVKIAASALKTQPVFNSAIDPARGEIVERDYYHIGVAVDTERGLVVPVIRDADRKNVFEIALELARLAEKARARKLAADDMQGACFTITNLGGIGGGFFTPIVNHPEVGILGAGRAVTEPVSLNGLFQPRLMLPLSLSFDHRLVDGADGARFLRWIIEAIQQPVLISLEG